MADHHTDKLKGFDAQILAELRAIRDEMQAIRQVIEHGCRAQSGGRSRKPDDRTALDVLLPEIVRSIGIGVVFTTGDIFGYASADKQLRTALEKVFGVPLDKKAARMAGDMLKRSAGFAQGKFLLVRVRVTREGALWQVLLRE